MTDMTMFFVAQSGILVMAIVATYVATKVQIAKLEVHVAHLREDHKNLATQMRGVSRSLAELSGACVRQQTGS